MKKKRKPKKRNYKREYKMFHGKPEQIKLRSMRNQARRILKLKKGQRDSKERLLECDHIIPLSAGGTNHRSNLRIVPRSVNRKKGKKTNQVKK